MNSSQKHDSATENTEKKPALELEPSSSVTSVTSVAKIFAFLTPLLLAAGHAAAADWRMDASASRLDFAATFEKTPAPGVFKEFDTRFRSEEHTSELQSRRE